MAESKLDQGHLRKESFGTSEYSAQALPLPPRGVKPKHYDGKRHSDVRSLKRTIEFETETRSSNLEEFYDIYGERLPLVVMVTQGFYGDIIQDTFDRGEVIFIKTISRQRRVVATFTFHKHERLISIPVAYHENMCVVKHGKVGKEMSLDEILQKYRLPLNVQFPKDRKIMVSGRSVSSNHIPTLKLVQEFDEMYFLGNVLLDTDMSRDVVHIPLYLHQLAVAPVTSVKGQDKEHWKSYLKDLQQQARKIHYDQAYGNPDIAEYDPTADHSGVKYSYMQPHTYASIVSLVQTPNAIDRRQRAHQANEVYETFRSSQEDEFYQTLENKKSGNNPSTRTHIERPMSENNSRQQTRTYFYNGNRLSDSNLKEDQNVPKKRQIANSKSEASGYMDKNNSSVEQRTNTISADIRGVRHETISGTPTKNIQRHVYLNKPQRLSSGPKYGHCPPPPPVSSNTSRNSQNLSRNIENVSDLSVNEVCICLKKLNLEKYAECFRDHMVDGKMLKHLDESILKDDFNMGKIESIRLLKFIREGHIPS